MKKWLTRIGYTLIIIALAAPLAEYLPVDLMARIINFVNAEKTAIYFKVVATNDSSHNDILILVIGIILVLIGKYGIKKTIDTKTST